MKAMLAPTFVMQRDGRGANTVFTVLTILVALSMFVAAAGSGSGSYVTEQPLPAWVDIAANVLSALIGVLVLLPRTRVLGGILAIVNMSLSMYVNYTVDGVGYFVQVLPYNLITIMIAALLVGHYAEDLPFLLGRKSLSAD